MLRREVQVQRQMMEKKKMKGMRNMIMKSFISILKKLQKEIVEIRNKRAEIMSDAREVLQRCDTCDRMIRWNEVSKYEDCRIRESDNNENEDNKDIVNEVVDAKRKNRENEVRSSRRQ